MLGQHFGQGDQNAVKKKSSIRQKPFLINKKYWIHVQLDGNTCTYVSFYIFYKRIKMQQVSSMEHSKPFLICQRYRIHVQLDGMITHVMSAFMFDTGN
jgi:hypothetical protein